MTDKAPPPLPYVHPPCICSHPIAVHEVHGQGGERRYHACSAHLGPKGTPCGCRSYAPVVTS